jgi:4-hydroxyphenylpyruvate dioxygenase-like putative hemolysin
VYHLAPELFFVSSDEPTSPVYEWVKARQGGGLHHVAYNVDDVAEAMEHFRGLGWEFTTAEPIVDDDLTQCFTQPLEVLGGVIIELIARPPSRGFSRKNVRELMKSVVHIA